MSSTRSLNRKQFLALTVTTVAAGTLAACGEDTPDPGGTSGSGPGGGTGGTPPAGGSAGTAGNATAGSSSGSGGTPSTSGAGGGGGAGGSGGGAGGMSGGGGGGSGGGAGAGGAGGGMCNADISVMSSGDHAHSLTVTMAQIMTGAEVTIESGEGGGGNHTHFVKITAADFTALKAGMEVVKKSCSGGDHEYVLKCGGGGKQGGAPTCNDECGGMMANACS